VSKNEATTKYELIDPVFDLKTVNPNAVIKLDTRTPGEVIQSIEDQGKIVAKSLCTLQALLSENQVAGTGQ
jgi:type I restriction enzyme M protein